MKRRKEARKKQGSKWCTRLFRVAVHVRDRFACVYCGKTTNEGAELTLDHLTPWIRYGQNKSSNVVTACRCCNNARKDTPVSDFVNKNAKRLRTINRVRVLDVKAFYPAAKELLKAHKPYELTGNHKYVTR